MKYGVDNVFRAKQYRTFGDNFAYTIAYNTFKIIYLES